MNLVKYTIEIPTVLNLETISDLHQQLDKIEIEQPQFILLKSKSSDIFCRGMDLSWVCQSDDESFVIAAQKFASFLDRLQNSPCISISIVDGDVSAGGIGIVSASDLVLATKRSSFKLTEALLGLVPGLILSSLLNRLTPQTIKKMVFSAKAFSPSEALNIGLIDEIISASNIENSIDFWINSLKHCKKQSVIDLKSLLKQNRGDSDSLTQMGITLLQERLQDTKTRERLKNLAYFLEDDGTNEQ